MGAGRANDLGHDINDYYGRDNLGNKGALKRLAKHPAVLLVAFVVAFAATYIAASCWADAAPEENDQQQQQQEQQHEQHVEEQAAGAAYSHTLQGARASAPATTTTTAVKQTSYATDEHDADATQWRFGETTCDGEVHADYTGDAIVWGPNNIKASATECARQCAQNDRCNTFVFCPHDSEGCSGMPRGSCWIKHAPVALEVDPKSSTERVKAPAARSPSILWTSGSCATTTARVRLREEAKRVSAERFKRRDDQRNPRVAMDVSIKGQPIGEVSFVLYAIDSPHAAENFRLMCTGELGKPYTFANAPFYRIIDAFINQAGVQAAQAAVGEYRGRAFPDDQGGLKLRHDRPGLLSVANAGPDTNTGHFSVVMNPAPHLDGSYVIFGELLDGMSVMNQVNALAMGKETTASAGARIDSCRQIS